MVKVAASEITRTRQALLGYVARLGVVDETGRRLLTARLWRALPAHLNAAQTIVATDRLLSQWASARIGFPITAPQLRLAILETGADARALLSDNDVAGFIATITPVLLQATPQETLVDMPVQALTKAGILQLLSTRPVALGQPA